MEGRVWGPWYCMVRSCHDSFLYPPVDSPPQIMNSSLDYSSEPRVSPAVNLDTTITPVTLKRPLYIDESPPAERLCLSKRTLFTDCVSPAVNLDTTITPVSLKRPLYIDESPPAKRLCLSKRTLFTDSSDIDSSDNPAKSLRLTLSKRSRSRFIVESDSGIHDSPSSTTTNSAVPASLRPPADEVVLCAQTVLDGDEEDVAAANKKPIGSNIDYCFTAFLNLNVDVQPTYDSHYMWSLIWQIEQCPKTDNYQGFVQFRKQKKFKQAISHMGIQRSTLT